MTSWKTYKLKEVVQFNPTERIAKGTLAKKVSMDKLVPYCREVSAYEVEAFTGGMKFRNGDTIMARITPCLENGKTSYVSFLEENEVGFGSTEYIVFRAIEDVTDSKFIYYFVTSPAFRNVAIKSMVGSSGRQRVQQSVLEDIEVAMPSLAEQRRIAGILGAIDDKIENNRRINTNLELQAQALYKQWFVDFEFPNEEGKPYKSSGGKMVDSELGLIPEGWSVGTLSDLADVTMGQSPNGKSFNENGDGIVFYQGRTEFGVRYPSIRLYTTEPTRYAEPMSVLLSVRAPVGDINIATQRCCIGRGVASIKSKTDDNAYMYCCLKELRPQLDQYNGEGTVFGSINRKELEGLVLCIPKYEIISKFNDVILGTDKQMLNLFQQTQNLATLRDTLLPKLMNGEIKL